MVLTVQNTTTLLPGMSVVGAGVPDGTDIAASGIIDATHIRVTKNVAAQPTGTLINLTFNSLRGPNFTRTFDNFYGIFLPDGAAWSLQRDANGNATLSASLGSKNYFSVAALPGGTGAEFNKFLPRAYTFVTGSTSSFNFDEATGKVTTTYVLQTVVKPGTSGAAPLQALNATQYNNLPADELQALKTSSVAGLKYVSPHGSLLMWDGAVFHTQLQYTGVLPSAVPLGANQGQADLWKNYLLPVLRSASSQPEVDGSLALDLLFPNDNNYLQAQAMYGASQLVPILLEISTSTDPLLSANDKAQAASYAEQLYNAVKDRMSSWLSASDDQALQVLYYQPATPQETNPKQPAPPTSRAGSRS